MIDHAGPHSLFATPGSRNPNPFPGSTPFPGSEIFSNPFSSAQLLSRYRPRAAVIAVTRSAQAARQAHLCRGVFPLLYSEPPETIWADDVDRRVQFGIESGEPSMFPTLCSPGPGLASSVS